MTRNALLVCENGQMLMLSSLHCDTEPARASGSRGTGQRAETVITVDMDCCQERRDEDGVVPPPAPMTPLIMASAWLHPAARRLA